VSRFVKFTLSNKQGDVMLQLIVIIGTIGATLIVCSAWMNQADAANYFYIGVFIAWTALVSTVSYVIGLNYKP
jgi:hypothetical protein